MDLKTNYFKKIIEIGGKKRKKDRKNKEFYNTKFKFDLKTLNHNLKIIFNIINYIMNLLKFIFRKYCIHDDDGDDDVVHNSSAVVEVHNDDNVVHNTVVVVHILVVRSTFLFIYNF